MNRLLSDLLAVIKVLGLSFLIILLLAFSVIMYFLISSEKTEETIEWNKKTLKLKIADGGATTSHYFTVAVKGIIRDKVIFQSYGDPYIIGMKVSNDILLLQSLGFRKTNEIPMNLKLLDSFYRLPIKYHRNVLESLNPDFEPPAFIRPDSNDFPNHKDALLY